ncbi:MAG: aminopeptidase P family protein, partial [Phycisphaerae bacterium]|nr:aminopeptidase P family protein [Phycisphaerae bacterium]
KTLRVRALAVQSEHLSLQARGELAKAVGSSRLRDSVGLLSSLRLLKDASEIAAITRGAKIQQAALLATLPTIRPGQSERQIAARLEFEMKSRGADGLSFETIVAARANGSKPHYRPGGEKTAKGKPLLIDWGARVEGYCSDMTRTFSIGSWPRKLKEVYRVVLEAHLAAIDAVKPGMTCGELDGVARGIIARAGYGKEFGHGLGHGIGLDIHEAPRVFTTTQTVLEPGMVITIEPGVYLPGVGGVRIEDDILVTDRGARNLCSLPKDLEWATLHG